MLVNVLFQSKKLTLDRGENELVLAAFLKNLMRIPFYQEVLPKSTTAYKPEQLTLFGPKLVHTLGKFQIINLHYFNVRWCI